MSQLEQAFDQLPNALWMLVIPLALSAYSFFAVCQADIGQQNTWILITSWSLSWAGEKIRLTSIKLPFKTCWIWVLPDMTCCTTLVCRL